MASNHQNIISDADFQAHIDNYIAPDPSPRNPRISTHSNVADRIEAAYQADGHQTWGYAIYRTTYANDAAWTEFMRRLRIWTTLAMDFCGGRDVLDRMTWTIFDDRERFEGVDAAAVRRHFRGWAEGAVRSERADGAGMGRSPRYRYCLQVDAAALRSVVHDGPAVADDFDPYRDRQGWVKVIDKNWLPRSENPIWAGRPPDPNTYEPIDGCTDENVGWVLCPPTSVLTEYYMHFQDVNAYTRSYRRAPAVVGDPWN